ncbi:Titin homolog [Linum perenne]
MVHFEFKSNNNHFITSPEGTTLQVYEFTKHTIHPSSIRKIHWNPIATIHPENPTDHKQAYDGVTFPEDRGTIEGREALTMLARHLNGLQLLVSSEGYCFQEVSDLGMYSNFGVHYLRLNDLFNWQRYTIDRALTTNVNEYWRRLDLEYNDPISTPPVNHPTTKPIIIVGGGGVPSKENYSKLQRLVKEKDEELAKLKKEKGENEVECKKNYSKLMKEKNEELAKLKGENDKNEVECKKNYSKLMKEKNEELAKLKEENDKNEAECKKNHSKLMKEKDEELAKLKGEKDKKETECKENYSKLMKEKNEELAKLKGENDKNEAECKKNYSKLAKEKDEEFAKLKGEKDEELAKLKKEKDKNEAECKEKYSTLVKEKNEELAKLKGEKDKKEAEYQLLQQGKFVEEAKTRKVEGELKEARDKLGQLIHQLEAIEQTKKESWAILSSTKFLPEGSDNNLPTRKSYSVKLVDEGWSSSSSSSINWPSPPHVMVFNGTGQEFDRNNW